MPTVYVMRRILTALFIIHSPLFFSLVAAQDLLGPVPPAPDYSDPTQWYKMEKGAAADFFYIVSTETGDYVKTAKPTTLPIPTTDRSAQAY